MPDENTVSVEAGSTTVLGHLTQFVGFAGDTFNCGGMSVPVAAVVSTSELTLAYGWPSTDVVDSAAWVLMPTSAEWSSTVSLHKAIVEANAWRNGKFPFPFNNGGPISKRSLFDGEPMGFTFLELTGDQDDPFRLYGKLSDASGDWSVGQTLRGDAAISTGEAIAAAALAQAWATQGAGEVEPGEGYSAKYHAGLAAGSAGAASTSAGAAAGSASAASGSAGSAAGSATASGNSATAAAGSATTAATARDLAQQWATKTDGEVVAGQGRGAKYYSDQTAATLAGAIRHDIVQSLAAANQLRARGNAGLGAAIEAVNSLTPAADRFAYYTSANGAALTSISAVARAFLTNSTLATLWQSGLGATASGLDNGYQKLPNGIIWQWGYVAAGGTADLRVSWPTAFTNKCWAVVSIADLDSPSAGVIQTSNIATTAFDVRRRAIHNGGVVEANSGIGVRWMAVGL